MTIDHKAQSGQGYTGLVTVDMRALVDKVLARYSAKFSVFRELLQNSDDAGCDSAEIRFETSPLDPEVVMGDGPPKLPDLDITQIVQWTFRNHGKEFTEEDWTRLPKIALGNPDPRKIGAFGVGFFSVFSVTENPYVSSGDKEMEFWWDEDNQLRYRFDDLPQAAARDLWTTFKIPLREPVPMPPIMELLQFLASSITFMVHLEKVTVFFDHHRVGQINKSLEQSQVITIPTELRQSSSENIMMVNLVEKHRKSFHHLSITIEARVMLPQYDFHETTDVTVFTAEVDVTVDTKLSKELDRCMKKKTTDSTQVQIDIHEHDQNSMGKQNHASEFPSLLQGLRADLDGAINTRVYIGHATAQTTGIGGHMASHFIPTVERESVDLADINVAIWNRELLHIGGVLCRAVYELELSKIHDLWEEAAASEPHLRPSRELQNQLHKRFLHVLKFFTFHRSTPSSTVAELLADSFYGCSTLPLRLLSSVGVRGAPHIREFDSVLAKFLKSVPMLSEHVTQYGAHSIAALPDKHKISAITPSDILQDLRGHTMNAEELIALLRWLIAQGQDDLTPKVLNAATFGNAGGKTRLSSIHYFLDPQVLGVYIPPDGPLPLSLIPLDISKHFGCKELTRFGWEEFTVLSWLQHISRPEVTSTDKKYDFTSSGDWASRVLSTLRQVWPQISEDMRSGAAKVVRNKSCIPTSKGLCCPESSYLPIADDAQFHHLDLPIVSCDAGFEVDVVMERCLLSLGVQKDPPIRFLLAQGNWTVFDLIKYLTQDKERSLLTDDDLKTLKISRIFMREHSQGNDEENTGYRTDELYPPVDTFRKLRLPVIEWKEKLGWSDTSREAQWLYGLGLNHFPSLPEIVELCSSKDDEVQETAFTYLCGDFIHSTQFTNQGTSKKWNLFLSRAMVVYSGTQWKALGFSIIHERYLNAPLQRLGISQHPPTSNIMDQLGKSPPRDWETAHSWFEVLSDHIPAFSSCDRINLLGLSFVPTGPSSALKWLPATKCYLDRGSIPPLHAKLFDFVDFGYKANVFLQFCGSKDRVSFEDVAEALIENPEKFFGLQETSFLAELRMIAHHSRDISNRTLHKMSGKPALLGVRRKKIEGSDSGKYEHQFLTSQEVTIVDDLDDYRLFSDSLFVAPQEEVLEGFYKSLGCNDLSAIVQERCRGLHEIQATETCLEVQSRILERLPLFIRKYTDFQPKVKVPSSTDQLKVKAWGRILVFKTLVTMTGSVERQCNVRVFARHEGNCIELWISKTAKPDMYEIATSLCRLFFGANKTYPTLLLEKALSADLKELKRRGFPVDQICQKHRDKYGVENKAKRKLAASASTTISPRPSVLDQSDCETFSGSPEATPQPSPHRVHTTDRVLPKSREAPIVPDDMSGIVEQSTLSRTPLQVIPQSDIRETVKKVIEGCNLGGKGSTILADMNQFTRNSFCGLPAGDRSLHHDPIGKMKGIQVHVDKGVPDANGFMARMHGPLGRFVDIIISLSQIYHFSTEKLRIFYDVSGGCIAFNRGGIIYLNLRYFDAWREWILYSIFLLGRC
ncbi:hypothetical protein L210DRAFT_3651176 [Boletus edulis BED1]|uniref:Sacsin/Nov domain-containing protein n=1 Tax=Boletus edulis BED1 TaxID=1328754 RepID=A0AAD4BIS8_BOLED|nr:hypothetical protein L210DRAFT_3651176 [Boletus edulis BED1]